MGSGCADLAHAHNPRTPRAMSPQNHTWMKMCERPWLTRPYRKRSATPFNITRHIPALGGWRRFHNKTLGFKLWRSDNGKTLEGTSFRENLFSFIFREDKVHSGAFISGHYYSSADAVIHNKLTIYFSSAGSSHTRFSMWSHSVPLPAVREPERHRVGKRSPGLTLRKN